MIVGYKEKSYTQRLMNLRLTTLEERYHRADMLLVYKIINDINGIYPEIFLLLNERPGRNNSIKLYKGRSNLDIKKYCFTSRVVDNWNALPDSVVMAADVNAFKSCFDHYMRDVKGLL